MVLLKKVLGFGGFFLGLWLAAEFLLLPSGYTAPSGVYQGTESGLANVTPLPVKGWELGGHFYYYKYEEPDIATLEGFYYGFVPSYTFRSSGPGWAARVESPIAFGNVDYEGSGTAENIRDFVVEPRGWVGYDFPTGGGHVLTPFFGVGYRRLENSFGGMTTNTGALGYDRISQYIYSPLGLEYFMPIGSEWSATLAWEYDFFWDGKQRSELSDAIAGLADVENDQNDGYGMRVSLRIARHAAGHNVVIKPFFHYWNVDTSDISNIVYQGVAVGYGFEPENDTIEAGVEVSAEF